MFASIRHKLLITYVLVATLSTGSLASYVLYRFRSFYLARVREDLHDRAIAVADEVGEALESGDRARLRSLAQRLAGHSHLTFRVLDGRMNLLVSSRVPPPDYPPWLNLPGMREARRGREVSGVMSDEGPGSEKLYVVLPLQRGPKRLGYVRMSLLLGDFQRVFARVQAAVAVGVLAVLAGCAAISLLLARSLSDPIRQMSLFAERVGAGQLGERLAIPASDEIGRLGAALSRMSERLARQEQDRRDFLAAVSHELRTPAANIQVTLEALLADADGEPALRERFLTAALRESERLSQLVRDLIDLARLEAGGVRMAAEPVRLADVVARASEAMEPRLREGSLSMEANVRAEVWVTGDADRLLQALLNLLDNAARFSPPGSSIRIAVVATSQEAELAVEDDGPGIPETDLPFVFDRFYTADKSRARGSGGTGLGLAIVREIVEAHHGHVEAANIPGAGARFTVRLPRALNLSLTHP